MRPAITGISSCRRLIFNPIYDNIYYILSYIGLNFLEMVAAGIEVAPIGSGLLDQLLQVIRSRLLAGSKFFNSIIVLYILYIIL